MPVAIRHSRMGLPIAGAAALATVGAAIGLVGGQQPLFALGAVLLAGLAVAIFLWPEAATLLVIFLMWANVPAVAVTQQGAPFVLGALVPFLLVVPLVANSFHGNKLRIGWPFLWLTLFMVALIVATVQAKYQDVALERILTFAVEGIVAYFLVINAVRTPETLRRCVWAMLAAGAFLAAITVTQKLTGNWTKPYGGFGKVEASYFILEDAVPRAAGPLGDPNYYAQILLVLVPLGLITVWRESVRTMRLLAVGATLLICAAIMITNSRGAALGFGVVLIAMTFMGYVKPARLVPVIAAIILLLSFVPEYRDRVSTLSTVGAATTESGTEGADESTRSRTTEMMAATLVFSDHPLFGVGPAGFPRYYQEYAARVGLQIRETTHTGKKKGQEAERESHNLFLSVAADLGLFGLVAFCGFIFATTRQLLRRRRRLFSENRVAADLAGGFFVGIVAYLSSGVFLTLAFERYFWLLMGLAGAAALLPAKGRSVDPLRARRP